MKVKWKRRVSVLLLCATPYQYPTHKNTDWYVSESAKVIGIICRKWKTIRLGRLAFYGLPCIFDWLNEHIEIFTIFPYPPTDRQLWLGKNLAYYDWVYLWPFWASLRGVIEGSV